MMLSPKKQNSFALIDDTILHLVLSMNCMNLYELRGVNTQAKQRWALLAWKCLMNPTPDDLGSSHTRVALQRLLSLAHRGCPGGSTG